ncbi:hypothetical protein [Paeniglutamicibacter antarcticus]|uniref:DUF4352 domain-containing protein n=1 Tax=Paeniglutamicibacter antarcticus TaxID=494023 RepID=A0ABP9TMZ5_9MICC
MKQTISLGAACILAIALLTGCTASSEEPAASASVGAAGTAAQSGQDAPAEGTEPRVVSVDTSTVIAEQEYSIPGTNDKVNIGVQSLQVEGQTMTLQLVLTPEFTSISDSEAVSIYAATGSTRFNPKLIDRENLKEYSLISDTGQDWATNRATTKTTNHEPVIWWGFYAAPEDNNDAFELRVLDAMAEFTDVPVTR